VQALKAGVEGLLARFGSLPEFWGDNPKLWNILPDPFTFRVQVGDAPSCGRVFDKALSIPD